LIRMFTWLKKRRKYANFFEAPTKELKEPCRIRIAYHIYLHGKEQTMEINDLNNNIIQTTSRLAEEKKSILKADTAYKNYLDGKEPVHDFNDVVKELGLGN
jgi:hypothetical protein